MLSFFRIVIPGLLLSSCVSGGSDRSIAPLVSSDAGRVEVAISLNHQPDAREHVRTETFSCKPAVVVKSRANVSVSPELRIESVSFGGKKSPKQSVLRLNQRIEELGGGYVSMRTTQCANRSSSGETVLRVSMIQSDPLENRLVVKRIDAVFDKSGGIVSIE
jgi:hypothetical protein